MIVNVTPRQFQYIEALAGDGVLADTFRRDHQRTGKGTWFDVTAPYLAWEIIARRLEAAYLAPSLGRTPKTPDAALRLIAHIAKAQNTMQRHPAMRGAAMIGIQAGWFPVWIHSTGIVSPMPLPGATFTVIGPKWSMNDRGMRVTRWDPSGMWPRSHWLASEDAHTRLLREES